MDPFIRRATTALHEAGYPEGRVERTPFDTFSIILGPTDTLGVVDPELGFEPDESILVLHAARLELAAKVTRILMEADL